MVCSSGCTEVAEGRGLIHGQALAHLQLNGMHVLRGLTTVARDVTALEAAIHNMTEG